MGTRPHTCFAMSYVMTTPFQKEYTAYVQPGHLLGSMGSVAGGMSLQLRNTQSMFPLPSSPMLIALQFKLPWLSHCALQYPTGSGSLEFT